MCAVSQHIGAVGYSKRTQKKKEDPKYGLAHAPATTSASALSWVGNSTYNHWFSFFIFRVSIKGCLKKLHLSTLTSQATGLSRGWIERRPSCNRLFSSSPFSL